MKNWMWTALVTILMFAIIVLLKMPFWVFLVIAAPLLTIIFIYGSFLYSFRESLQMEAAYTNHYPTRENLLPAFSRTVPARFLQNKLIPRLLKNSSSAGSHQSLKVSRTANFVI